MKSIFFIFTILVFSQKTVAHPVIWKGGTVLSFRNTELMNDYRVHYSVTQYRSHGIHYIKIGQKDYAMIQNNFLLKRWNQLESQGNFYLSVGLGANLKISEETIGHSGLQADWETRLLYTQVSFDHYKKKDSLSILRGRIGLSPYLADFEDIHTWIILQLTHQIQKNRYNKTIMPVVRLFKGNILVELASNFTNDYLLTIMIHY